MMVRGQPLLHATRAAPATPAQCPCVLCTGLLHQQREILAQLEDRLKMYEGMLPHAPQMLPALLRPCFASLQAQMPEHRVPSRGSASGH
jgi:hypothetical protein